MAKRVRDYRKEELQRNLKWQAFGFTSRAQARGARKRGELPSEREIKDNTEDAVRKLAAIQEKLKSPEQQAKRARSAARGLEQKQKVQFTEAQRPLTAAQARGRTYQDERCHQWSLAHSRQDASKWSDSFKRPQKDAYFAAFVDGWNLPHDERNLRAVYDYLITYAAYDPDPENPYWQGFNLGG